MIFLTLLLTTGGVYLYTKQQVDESRQELKMLNEHRTRATDLYESWQSMQYEMRGFVLLGDEEMLKEIEAKKNDINQQTTWFERNARFKEERQYATDARGTLYSVYPTRHAEPRQLRRGEKRRQSDGTVLEDADAWKGHEIKTTRSTAEV